MWADMSLKTTALQASMACAADKLCATATAAAGAAVTFAQGGHVQNVAGAAAWGWCLLTWHIWT